MKHSLTLGGMLKRMNMCALSVMVFLFLMMLRLLLLSVLAQLSDSLLKPGPNWSSALPSRIIGQKRKRTLCNSTLPCPLFARPASLRRACHCLSTDWFITNHKLLLPRQDQGWSFPQATIWPMTAHPWSTVALG